MPSSSHHHPQGGGGRAAAAAAAAARVVRKPQGLEGRSVRLARLLRGLTALLTTPLLRSAVLWPQVSYAMM